MFNLSKASEASCQLCFLAKNQIFVLLKKNNFSVNSSWIMLSDVEQKCKRSSLLSSRTLKKWDFLGWISTTVCHWWLWSCVQWTAFKIFWHDYIPPTVRYMSVQNLMWTTLLLLYHRYADVNDRWLDFKNRNREFSTHCRHSGTTTASKHPTQVASYPFRIMQLSLSFVRFLAY